MIGRSLLEMAIDSLIFAGGDENAIILKLGTDYYVQFASRKGAFEVYGEAISNQNIAVKDAYLNEKQINQLLALGWKIPAVPGNLYLVHAVDSEASRTQLINILSDTITGVYGIHEIRESDFIVDLR